MPYGLLLGHLYLVDEVVGDVALKRKVNGVFYREVSSTLFMMYGGVPCFGT